MFHLVYFFFFLLRPAQAHFSNDILFGCEKWTHAQYLKKFHEVELQVVEAFEKNPNLSQTSNERELFEVVFPHDLPRSHPMKNAFLSCFSFFEEYRSAKNKTQFTAAVKRLEKCYARSYKKDPPKVISQYISCLNKIRH